METKLSKTEFFQKYGGGLLVVSPDDCEYGDYLIMHPEEIDKAKQLEKEGYTIASVFENEEGDDTIIIDKPFDSGQQLFKIGYFAFNE